jgi:voltage-gated sodium channel
MPVQLSAQRKEDLASAKLKTSVNAFKAVAAMAGQPRDVIAEGWPQDGDEQPPLSGAISDLSSHLCVPQELELERELSRISSRTSRSYERVLSKYVPEEVDKRELYEERLTKFMGCMIILNALTMALELDFGPEDGAPLKDRVIWFVAESIFLMLFLFELVLRVYWERSAWVRSWWNWLDFFVICVGMLESWILALMLDGDSQLRMITLLRIVRLVRLLRVAKLMRAFRSFYVTVLAFREAIRSMLNILCIMVSGIFLCSIFTTATIGRSEDLRHLQMGPADGKERFGSIPRSMYTLFELMTLEGWDEMGRPLVMTEPAFGIFLFLFIMVFTFGLLNMIVAMVVEKTLEQARHMKDQNNEQTQEEVEMELFRMRESFAKGDGYLTLPSFEQNLGDQESKIAECLKRSGIPIDDAATLFNILDVDLNGCISFEELLTGCSRIHDASDYLAYEMLATQAGMRVLQRSLTNLRSEVRSSLRVSTLDDGRTSKSYSKCTSLASSVSMPPATTASQRVRDSLLPHSPPSPLASSACSSPLALRQVNFPVVPGEVNVDITSNKADHLPFCSSLTATDQMAEPKVEKSLQTAVHAGLLKSLEVDAVAAYKDMMCGLEADCRARVAAQEALLLRLDASVANQEEAVRRLTLFEDLANSTARQLT